MILHTILQNIQGRSGVSHEFKARAHREFAKLNGWKVTRTSTNFRKLSRQSLEEWHGPNRIRYIYPNLEYDSEHMSKLRNLEMWTDHAVSFIKDRKPVACVGQPYGHLERFIPELRTALALRGLILHTPPAGPYASIWFPSATLFLVVTRPDTVVQWLPEQQTPNELFQGRKM